MAHFGAASYGERNSGLIPLTGNAAYSFWFRQRSLPTGSDYNVMYGYINNTPSTYDSFAEFYVGGGTQFDTWEVTAPGDSGAVGIATKPAGRWRHIFIIDIGLSFSQMHLDGVYIGSTSRPRGYFGIPFAYELLGGDATSIGDMDILHLKRWHVASGGSWTVAQLRAEMLSKTPVRTANLWSYHPLTADLNDTSVNARHFTGVGTITFTNTDQPPYFDVPNTTSAGALALTNTSLTFIENKTVPIDFPFFNPARLWYEFNPVASGWVSFFLHASGAPTDKFMSQFIIHNSALTDEFVETNIDTPGFFYAEAGETYFIEVLNSGANLSVSAETLVIDVLGFGANPIFSPGSVVINNDVARFPAAVLDPTTGDVIGLLGGTLAGGISDFASGERGASLVTGEALLSNEHDPDGTPDAVIVDRSMTVIAGLTVDTPIRGLNRNASGTFWYLMDDGNGINRVDPDGTVTLVATHSFTNDIAIAVSPDETIAYVVTSPVTPVIKRWNLTSDSVLSNFFTSPASDIKIGVDIIVLPTGDVVFSTWDTTPFPAHDFTIYRYSAAGALVQTYPFPSSHRINHMAISNEPGKLAIWSFKDSDTSITGLTTLDLTTGIFTPNPPVETRQFFGGASSANAPDDGYDPTPQRFGAANSCPFWIQQLASLVRVEEDPGELGAGDPSLGTDCCETQSPTGDTGVSPDPIGEFPAFLLTCIGGGQIDTNSPLVNGEAI